MMKHTEIYYNKDILSNLIKEIKQAKNKIYVMHFWITYKEIIDLLIAKKKFGVDVRIVTDHRTYLNKLESYEKRYDISALEYLWKNDINAKVFKGEMMHHKTIIIDNEILLMGSYNLYKESLHLHNEDLIIINNTSNNARVTNEFFNMYETQIMTKKEIINKAKIAKINSFKLQFKNKLKDIIKKVLRIK